MRVETLATTQFRNLRHPVLSFAPGVNLFTGDNGQGKTNLLEAVFIFKFGRSFRTRRDDELIRFSESFCRSETACTFDDGHRERFSIAIERGGAKKVELSGAAGARLSALVGRFPVVLFGPQDLKLVAGQPGERRRFIDMVGSMTDPSYLSLLRGYRRVLSQRNAALKSRASPRERDSWNTELVDTGCALIGKRREVTAALDAELARHAAGLDVPARFSLSYQSEVLRDQSAAPDLDLRSVFEARLLSLESEELRRGTTLTGPHRDDIAIRREGEDVRRFGSQGQQRLAALLLKMAELSHLESRLRERCVLLLDDVFAEFDPAVTSRLQGVLQGDRQVLVTSPVPLDWAGAGDVTAFALRGGTVSPIGRPGPDFR